MLIKSVDIQGFKSFADRTRLQFSKGLTAVVGPNGSGKSNVSDAVRWVLGEQSTKQLRGQSMEDVIFSGTEKRKGHGFCEVTINFDNTDRTLAFDDDRVSVTRRYYRSHESEYLINGNFVRLKDVHELFMDTGLGRDGYSMIGQGKIDNIVSSKSGERRDIFEEAAGISRYRYRKEESERKLQLAEENLLRLRDIEGELKQRIEPLKHQSEQAARFLELSEEKKELEIGLWLNTLDTSKENFRKHEAKIAAATAQYAELDGRIVELENKLDDNSALFAELTEKIDGLRKEAGDVEQKIARYEGEINVAKTTIAHNEQNLERLRDEASRLGEDEQQSGRELLEKTEQKAGLEQKLSEINSDINSLTEELSGLISKSEDILKQRESVSLKLNDIAVKISENKAVLSGTHSTIAEIEGGLSGFPERLHNINSSESEYKKELIVLKNDLDRAESALKSSENSKNGYLIKLETRKEAAQKIQDDIAQKRKKADDLLRRAEMLAELDKNMDGFSYAVKEVLKASENHRLKGIEGAVARLLKVEGKYALAIEVALAAAVGNIVTASDADAKQAIAYLKENRLGRATFLPITSLRPSLFNEPGLRECEGFIGLANELIKYDTRYETVFRWLLGRTAVCEDLDSAVAIAKKFNYRFKTVSLDGQVVNPGGSLTGGSAAKNAGTLSRADDIVKLKNEAERLDKENERLSEELKKAESAKAEVEAGLLNADSAIMVAKEDKIRLLGEIKRVNDLLTAVSAQKTALIEERDAQGNRLSALKTDAERVKDDIRALEKEQTSIRETEPAETDETVSRRAEIGDRLTALRLSAVDVQKDMEILEQAIGTLGLSSEDRRQRGLSLETEIKNISDNNSDLEQQIASLNDLISKTRDDGAEYLKNSEELAARRNALEGENSRLRAEEKDINADKEKVSGEIARLNERKEVMMSELDDIIARLYDEYELTKSEAEEMDIKLDNIPAARKRLSAIKSEIKSLGSVNLSAIEEYKEVSDRYEFLSGQISDVEKSKKELLKLIDELMEQMKTMFLEGFTKIGANFTKTFSQMFGGGHAELKLTDPDNVLQSGIDIVARLPGKNVPSLDVLSGGEKALIAISIYFAIMQVNPPPFCFLDEVESALDEINVERFARYMKNSGLPTQFICITHRRGTMENADMLYGVTMQEKGVSKLIELNVAELEKHLKTLNVEQ